MEITLVGGAVSLFAFRSSAAPENQLVGKRGGKSIRSEHAVEDDTPTAILSLGDQREPHAGGQYTFLHFLLHLCNPVLDNCVTSGTPDFPIHPSNLAASCGLQQSAAPGDCGGENGGKSIRSDQDVEDDAQTVILSMGHQLGPDSGEQYFFPFLPTQPRLRQQ